MDTRIPTSLITATAEEGLQLAQKLARASLPASTKNEERGMQAHLSTSGALPGPELLTALYFQAVSTANQGWSRDGKAGTPCT